MVALNMQVNQSPSGTDIHSSVTFDLRGSINRLYDELAEALLRGVLNESITSELAHEIAQLILKKLDAIESKDELLVFLHDLSTKWSSYNPFYIKMKYEDEKKQDDAKIADVQAKLKQFMSQTYGTRTTVSR